MRLIINDKIASFNGIKKGTIVINGVTYTFNNEEKKVWFENVEGRFIESSNAFVPYSFLESTNHSDNSSSIIKIHFQGYKNFSILTNSFGENNFDFLTISELDQELPGAVRHSWKGYSSPSFPFSSDNWKKDVFTNDGNHHFIYVKYQKDGTVNSFDDVGRIIIDENNEIDINALPTYSIELKNLSYSTFNKITNVWDDEDEDMYVYYNMGQTPVFYQSTNHENGSINAAKITFKGCSNFHFYIAQQSENEYDYMQYTDLNVPDPFTVEEFEDGEDDDTLKDAWKMTNPLGTSKGVDYSFTGDFDTEMKHCYFSGLDPSLEYYFYIAYIKDKSAYESPDVGAFCVVGQI